MAIPADPRFTPGAVPLHDARGRPLNPRTGRPRLSTGQLVALVVGAVLAGGALLVCSVLSLLLAFAADGCSGSTSREGNDACLSAMGAGVAIAYGSFFVLFVAGIVLLSVTKLRPLVRIGGLYLIAVLAPAAMVVAWIVAASGQPN